MLGSRSAKAQPCIAILSVKHLTPANNKPSDSGLAALLKEWRFLLFAMLMTFWSAPGQTFFIAFFSEPIREQLALSYAEFGGMYSAATLLSAAAILWSGSLVDRVPIPRFAMTVVVLLSAAMLLLSYSINLSLLFIALFLLRHFGQSLMMLTASTTVLRYLPMLAGRGTAISSLGYVIGEALLPIVVVALIAALGWTTSLQVLALAMPAIMLPAILLLLRNYKQRDTLYKTQLQRNAAISKPQEKVQGITNQDLPIKEWTRADVLRDPRFYLLLPAVIAQALLFTGFIFHQNFILESRGWSMHWWAGLFGLYAAISICSKLLTGFFIDKWGAIRLVPIAPIPLAIGIAALGANLESFSAIAFFIGLGLSVGMQSTLTGPLWLALYGSKHLGSVKSLSTSVIVFGSGITPLLLGALIDLGVSLEQLCWGSVIYLLSASALAVFAKSSRQVKPGYHNL